MAEQKKNWSRINTVACTLAVAIAVIWGLVHAAQHARILAEARTQAVARVHQATEDMDVSLNKLVPVNIDISEDLTSGLLPADAGAIEARLRAVKAEHKQVFGVGVAFVPYGFREDVQLYAPLFVDRPGGAAMVHIEDSYDYTSEERAWYQLPLKRGPIWQEPHYGIASQSYLANFTSPFFGTNPETGEREPRGVVFTSMSIDQFNQLIESLGLYETGYGFLISAGGAFVAHPNKSWVEQNKTITTWADETGDAALQHLAAETLKGKRGFAEHIDQATGKHQWVFVEPIISTGWCLGMVFDKENIVGWTALQNRQTMLIGFAGAVAVWLIATLAFAAAKRRAVAPSGEETPIANAA